MENWEIELYRARLHTLIEELPGPILEALLVLLEEDVRHLPQRGTGESLDNDAH